MSDVSAGESHLLVLERPGSRVDLSVQRAAEPTGVRVVADEDLDGALARAEQPDNRPHAIVLDVGHGHAGPRVAMLRSRMALAGVPIVGVATELTGLVFEEAYSLGVDDCCALEDEALGRVVRAIARAEPTEVARRPERVLIAEPDRDARLLVARVFRNAGFDVSFALDAVETSRQAKADEVAVVVCAFELADAIPTAAAAPDGSPVWIVNTPPKKIPSMRRHFATSGVRLAVHDAFSPPANLLFVANELMHRPGTDARRSERVLYGSSVLFRPAGASRGHAGYSYNISAGGLYVRTLAPPARGDELWMELVPPRSDRRVHIEARVVWARRWGVGQGATVPPGFGVEISGMTTADALRFGRGYEAFLNERAAARQLSVPPAASSID